MVQDEAQDLVERECRKCSIFYFWKIHDFVAKMKNISLPPTRDVSYVLDDKIVCKPLVQKGWGRWMVVLTFVFSLLILLSRGERIEVSGKSMVIVPTVFAEEVLEETRTYSETTYMYSETLLKVLVLFLKY